MNSETEKVEHCAASKQEPAKGSGKEKTMNVAAWIELALGGCFFWFRFFVNLHWDPEIFRMHCLAFRWVLWCSKLCWSKRVKISAVLNWSAMPISLNRQRHLEFAVRVKLLVDSCLFDALTTWKSYWHNWPFGLLPLAVFFFHKLPLLPLHVWGNSLWKISKCCRKTRMASFGLFSCKNLVKFSSVGEPIQKPNMDC